MLCSRWHENSPPAGLLVEFYATESRLFDAHSAIVYALRARLTHKGGDGWLIIIRVHLVFGLRISRFENIQTPKCQNLDYHFSILMWQYSLRLLHPSILKSVRRPSSSSFSLSCFLCLDCWNLLMTSSLFSLFTIIFSIANLYFNVKHAAKIQTYLESTKLLQIFFLINN